jgi:DNA-directed RNA polymerase specialized sigma24 family protein
MPRVKPPGNPFQDWPFDKSYIGKATPRKGGGWKIRIFRRTNPEGPEIELVGMTECATLERLEEKTWDFVRALVRDEDVHVLSVPDLDDGLMTRVIKAWAAMRDAKEAEAQAAKQVREVVKELRDRGLSITDIAWLTHVSRGRVSQLLI